MKTAALLVIEQGKQLVPLCRTRRRDVVRQVARAKGGRNTAKAARLRKLTPPRLLPIFDRLEAALGEVHAGTLDPRQATAMAALARALTTILQAGELEARVRDLEERNGGRA